MLLVTGGEKERRKRGPLLTLATTRNMCVSHPFFLMFSFSLFECVRDGKGGRGEMGEPGGLNVVPGFSCYLAASAADGRNMDVSPGGHGGNLPICISNSVPCNSATMCWFVESHSVVLTILFPLLFRVCPDLSLQLFSRDVTEERGEKGRLLESS